MLTNKLKIQEFLRRRPDLCCLSRFINWLRPRKTLQHEQYLLDLVLSYRAEDTDPFQRCGEISDLLDSGVDPNARGFLKRVEDWQAKGILKLDEADSSYPMSPLMAAVVIDAPELIELLMQYGATSTANGRLNCTPLHMAAKKMSPHCLQTLIDCGADIQAACQPPDYPTGTTPLHVAAEFSYNCVEELLRRGANPGVRDGRGQTPLYVACTMGHSRSVASLLTTDPRGEITNIATDENDTPLHAALRRGDVMKDSVMLMVTEKRADVTVRNADAQTPVLAAMEHGWSCTVFGIMLMQGQGTVFGEEHKLIDYRPDVARWTHYRGYTPPVAPQRRNNRPMWHPPGHMRRRQHGNMAT